MTNPYHPVKDRTTAGWTPMRRLATPEDIANVCALLGSEEAGFVTGQPLALMGELADESVFSDCGFSSRLLTRMVTA